MRGSAIKTSESGNRDSGEGGRSGDAGAVFDLASIVGSVSDQRTADGGVMDDSKKGEEQQRNIHWPLIPNLHGVCGKFALAGLGLLPASENWPQAPANQFGRATELC